MIVAKFAYRLLPTEKDPGFKSVIGKFYITFIYSCDNAGSEE